MESYKPQKIEPKWQKQWDKDQAFKADDKSAKEKFYCLDMFPYPSSHGLHVGHPEGYTATDIVSRYKRMNDFNVLHPMGWDAFGLPAENFAIKTGVHPQETTKKSIKTFKKQIKSLGFSYDWDREINTSDPDYYRWTQWIFLEFYKNGLAYKKKAAVNWCETCKTVLANEQVIDGRCERCKKEVIQKDLEQWFFKTTDYAQNLLEGLKDIDWPEPIKHMQENWIGKSEGAEIDFPVQGATEKIKVFTTRPDTLYGATYMVLSPEHELVGKITPQENREEVEKYIKKAQAKSELERTDLAKEKTGVFTGAFAINPTNLKKIPIWISDYVLASYGTGAIMCVPAHDERDWEFAKKFELEIVKVIEGGQADEECFIGPGKIVNSEEFDGQDWEEAKKKITNKVKGKLTVNYKIRDWLISRQRYWGAPIPIIHCDKCGEVPVPAKDLPVKLPTDVDFNPTGESPLASSESFQKVICPQCGANEGVRREADTMDTFVCSSWYYLRYCDPKDDKFFAKNNLLEKWMPVDLYVGGAEHAVMHLIYARFFYKALKDLGFIKIDKKIDHNEPFSQLRNQGMILGEDHQKMSKSLGNVVNPDDVVKEYGADTFRMYEMFMGAFEEVKPWDPKSIIGIRRFLDRVWKLQEKVSEADGPETIIASSHKTIKKVTEDIEEFGFNTAIAQMMIMVNDFSKLEHIPKKAYKQFIILLYPFAPHITSEIWERLDGEGSNIMKEKWPKYDSKLAIDEEIELVVQINGKIRDKILVSKDIKEDEAVKLALDSDKVQNFVSDKKIRTQIFVPGKLINIVI
ncbi:leucine--tRNA ligase [Patescibacteria group bacterium]|nr:leucine--tRNA ligase [Patescibacteria group bacterium]MBU1964136.1 leucine--tRNA ligase [Patescibacteria group bacterium]